MTRPELTDEQVERRERCLALVEQLMTLPCRCVRRHEETIDPGEGTWGPTIGMRVVIDPRFVKIGRMGLPARTAGYTVLSMNSATNTPTVPANRFASLDLCALAGVCISVQRGATVRIEAQSQEQADAIVALLAEWDSTNGVEVTAEDDVVSCRGDVCCVNWAVDVCVAQGPAV